MNLIYDTRLDASRRSLYERLKQLPPGRYTVAIEKYEKKRSTDLNSFYWGFVCTPLAQHCGETPERMHDVLCRDYWGTVTKEFRGKTYEVPRRTTTTDEHGKRDVLKGPDMHDFIHHCQTICAEYGVPVQVREYEAA